MNVRVLADAKSLGEAAAAHAAESLRGTLQQKGSARIIAATGASQFEFLEALASAPDLKGYGVVVSRALPGTPAERAGVQGGDVIEKIDAIDLNNGQTMGGVLQVHNPGDTVKLTALRGGSTVDMTLTLGDRPSTAPAC